LTAAEGPSSLVFVIPGDINLRTGGYAYDREIFAGLQRRGWDVTMALLDDSFPSPCDAARAHAVEALAALPNDSLVLADGLAFGALAEEAEREATRLRFVALVHHPLALESGLDTEVARTLFESERRALRVSRGVVVTSPATVKSLAPYGVPPDRIAVVPPGTKPAPSARGTRGSRPPRAGIPLELLAVASLTPRKGYDVLFHALARLTHLSWHLTSAGSPDLDPATADALARQALEQGIASRVTFAGALDEQRLDAAYDRADVFVLPTRHEGYGMAVAEAVARGIPVVSTPTGAIPELVDAASGRLVPIDDVEALTEALETVMDDGARARLADGACRRRETLPTWAEAVDRMAAALTRFATDGILQR
jgi:glycosyltransferase involved in cell wall biosynthesis